MKEPSDKLWDKWWYEFRWSGNLPVTAAIYFKWMRNEIKRLRARVKELEGR